MRNEDKIQKIKKCYQSDITISTLSSSVINEKHISETLKDFEYIIYIQCDKGSTNMSTHYWAHESYHDVIIVHC